MPSVSQVWVGGRSVVRWWGEEGGFLAPNTLTHTLDLNLALHTKTADRRRAAFPNMHRLGTPKPLLDWVHASFHRQPAQTILA